MPEEEISIAFYIDVELPSTDYAEKITGLWFCGILGTD